ncbi:radical SAM protein [Burkholderia ambifaria]|uniref:radical SAM protein n=1 Tax=Burkholderia ambifaria TaxID=152480 RepID=UPI0022A94BD0|nr:radical SAM protein [Burkholderia ambifaria]WAS54112.1 radical SAM protein [Burkholderia ambifaria]
MMPVSSPFLPPTISLYITYRCQSRCRHCFLVENGKIGRYELPLERCLRIIDEARDHRTYLLVLSGGEPLLHPEFGLIVEHARTAGLLPLIGLTGTGVTDEHIATLCRHGVPSVQVSLDGATALTNDAIRGAGNFDEVCNAIVRLRAAGLKVNLALCLHEQNRTEATALFECARRLGIARVKLSFYESSGSCRAFEPLTAEMKRQMLQVAAAFMRRNGIDDWIACPTHDVRTGREIRPTRRLPPLVIGADGELTAGEWGDRIGSLSDGSLATQYCTFVAGKQATFFERVARDAAAQHGIASVTVAHRDIGANALIYEDVDQRHIVVSEALTGALRFFTTLHEIGHVATHTLAAHPRRHASVDIERQVNLWVLDMLRDHISADSMAEYVAAASCSEAALYRLVDRRLDKDLINYW